MDRKFLGLVFFFIVLLASEETVIRSEAQTKPKPKQCLVPSGTFVGMCFDNSRCNQACIEEEYVGGRCTMDATRKCMCFKPCV
ncbi:hypothetical protein ACLB2K_032437 [Fragaria x ananassa]